MRILIASAPWWAPTGYGSQAKSLAKRLLADGHELAWMPLAGYSGGYARLPLDDAGMIDMLPQSTNDNRGNATVAMHANAWEADFVLSLVDIWPLVNYGGKQFRWCAWTPVDSDPIGPPVLSAAQRTWRMISMSRHGQANMNQYNVPNTYIPHGYEEGTFYPDDRAGAAFRQSHGIPEDAFVVGTVGFNYAFPSRKGFDRLFEAFARFAQGKENVYLYCHASPERNDSHDLNVLADCFNIRDKVIYPKPYTQILGYPEDSMRGVYNGMDCFALATHGEGFGIPVIEAQACGVPVIATNCTSMPELVADGVSGILVDPATHYMNLGYGFYYLIDIPKLAEAMENLYAEVEMADTTGLYANGTYRICRMPNVREIVTQGMAQYKWNSVYREFWRPWLKDVEREIASERASDTLLAGDSRSTARIEFTEIGAGIPIVRKHDGPLANVQSEYSLLSSLDHTGIIKPVATGTDEYGRFFYDMPRYGASLDNYTPKDETEIQTILVNLDAALNYLHDLGIAHRDVHPSNVVMRGYGDPVLIDFAWAKPCHGRPCVDFEPWAVVDQAVPSVQQKLDERGYHTVVNHLRGLHLENKTHGLKGVPYQAVAGAGERECQPRWDMMKPDVKGKSVIDLGCNLGWYAAKAYDSGAAYVVGIDNDEAVVEAARKLHPEVTFKVGDVTNGVLGVEPVDDEQFDTLLENDFDVAFLLSVLHHVKEPQTLLDRVRVMAKTVYVETPAYTPVSLQGSEVLGHTERGRPLVRFTR